VATVPDRTDQRGDVDDGWTDNGGVRIHYLEHRPADDGGRSPVVVVPGMGEGAREYAWLVEALADRHAVAVDVRGRGESDAPADGYTWEDHYGDVAAVVDAAAMDRPVVVGFSRGSSYALGYALAHPGRVRGIVMGDYFARHVGLPSQAFDVLWNQTIRGVPMGERMPEHAVRGVVDDSREVELWDRLPELTCPMLVLKAGRPSSILNEEQLERYRAVPAAIQIVLLPDAGHDLWSRGPDAYLAVLQPWLDDIDQSEFRQVRP
jgi:pimeloyl-ACP methyl ester carboxylesterase